MRAIIIKELRENLLWAVLLLIAVSAAMAFAVQWWAPVLVGAIMEMISAVAFPVAGLAIGLLQILQEHRGGRWAFLVHRPLSRRRIFMAKVIAGLALYGLATVPPLLAAIGWVATPGHVAGPFDIHMVLPRLADLLSGLVWYATGMLVAARQARWIGSRLMPLGFALLVTAFAWVFPLSFWQAALILAAGFGVIFPAAVTAFEAGGVFERQPALTRFLQGLSVGTGIALAVGVAAAMLAGAIDWIHPADDWQSQAYRINSDGQVIKDTYRGHGQTQETDPEGRPLSKAKRDDEYISIASVPLQGLPTKRSGWAERRQSEGLHNEMAYAYRVGFSDSAEWFYIAPRRVIEGFDPVSRRFIGSVGPNGFAPATEAPRPFPEPLHLGLRDFASRTAVFHVDFKRHEIHFLLRTTVDDPVIFAPQTFNTGKRGERVLSALLTRSTIYIFDGATELFRLPLEHSFPQYQALEIAQIRDGRFIFHYTNGTSTDLPQRDWLVEADADGHIIRRVELPPLTGFPRHDSPWVEAGVKSAISPFLLVLGTVLTEKYNYLAFIMAAVMGIVSAAFTFWLSRRYAMGRSASLLWTIFNLFAGIPGVLTLLSVRQLPAHVVCPHCGKRRVVTRDLCEHCAAPFSMPTLEGIEIFEMV
jgi:hypothetical protein